jgi:MoaA/NifB/PqqE/SkfB family radical SAM enzyme
MRRLLHLGGWFFKARFLGRRNPLQTVLFINDQCNLACKHCCIRGRGEPIRKSLSAIAGELKYAYELGSRFVDFEGGEPFLWQEGERGFNDLARLAKDIGFYSVTVTTNAQTPFPGCEADSIWVSLDGLGDYHDAIRGPGTFAALLKNLESSGHPRLSVNMVVNRLNHPSVRETIRFVRDHPGILSISLNFHTPYPGTEDLFLDWETRNRVLDEIISLKKAGYPVMNSVSGLKRMKDMNFTKRCWVTNFIMPDGERLAECQGKRAGLCDRCGFCMAGEMHSVFALKPDTILAGLNLRNGLYTRRERVYNQRI